MILILPPYGNITGKVGSRKQTIAATGALLFLFRVFPRFAPRTPQNGTTVYTSLLCTEQQQVWLTQNSTQNVVLLSVYHESAHAENGPGCVLGAYALNIQSIVGVTGNITSGCPINLASQQPA